LFDFLKKLFLPVVWFLDFITKYFKTIVFLTIVYFIFFSTAEDETIAKYNANLQKIDLIGEIIDPSKVLEDIERASNGKIIVLFELSNKYHNLFITQLYSGDVFHHQNTNFLCQRTIKNEYVWQTNKSLLISCRRR
jgi:hypothetical protein